MSPAKKRSAANGKGGVVAGMVLEQAIHALQDEKTREMLLEQAQAIASWAQRWHHERRAKDEDTGEPSRLGEQFGQGKLERRVENLTASLDSLTSGRPELADALAPVSDAVDHLRVSVEVAGRLPLVKRKQAHFRLDDELDRLEESLFEATFPSVQGDS